MIIQYDDNDAIGIDQEGNKKELARLRRLNFTKIVSLALEVL